MPHQTTLPSISRAVVASFLTALVIGILIGSALLQRGPLEPRTETTTFTLTTTLRSTVTTTVTAGTSEAPSQISAVCFSKISECDSLISRLLDEARRSIHVLMFTFTSNPLRDALIRAKERGVEVLVVIESKQAKVRGSEYLALKNAGINVRLDGNRDLMHHKFVVIDGAIVITGSYNWTAAAENKNDENVIVIEDQEIAALFEREFRRVWELSR